MRGKISQASARTFSRTLYERLLAHGVVDLAMNEARSTLVTERRADAAVPVLFMRLKDGRLWHRKTKTPTKDEAVRVSEPTKPNTASLRRRLHHLDSVEIETLCMDHFPRVYNKFSRGLRRDEMINLLLSHCRRKRGLEKLAAVLDEME
jgi:hypothetical protein